MVLSNGQGIYVKQSYLLIQNTRRKALTGVAQLVELQPAKRKVVGWTPSQGTCLRCRLVPGWGVCDRQLISVSLTHDVSLLLILSSFTSLQK